MKVTAYSRAIYCLCLIITLTFANVLNAGTHIIGDQFDLKPLGGYKINCKVVSINPNKVAIGLEFGHGQDVDIPMTVKHPDSGDEFSVTTIGFEDRSYDIRQFEWIDHGADNGYLFMGYWGTLTIPESVEYISPAFIFSCICKEFQVDQKNRHFGSKYGCLTDKEGHNLLRFPALAPVHVFELPEEFKSIGEGSFRNSFVPVILHDAIEEIPLGAFSYYHPKGFHFPYGLKKIDKYGFLCSNIGVADLPDGIESIGVGSFGEGPSNPSGEGVLSQDDLYYGGVRFAVFPETLKHIGVNAFRICSYIGVFFDVGTNHHLVFPNFVYRERGNEDRIWNYVFQSSELKIEKNCFPSASEDIDEYTGRYGYNCYGAYVIVPDSPEAVAHYKKYIEEDILPDGRKAKVSTDNNYIFLDGYLFGSPWIDGKRQMTYALIYGGDISPVSYSWESSDTSIAEVDENGMVSAKRPGEVDITLKVTDSRNQEQKAWLTIQVSDEAAGMLPPNFDYAGLEECGYPKGVYNLQGCRVANTPDNLPAGFYISNGKKIVITK